MDADEKLNMNTKEMQENKHMWIELHHQVW